jgi:HEAT repeat protein
VGRAISEKESRRRGCHWPLVAGVALMSFAGCEHFWDDITAHSPQGGFRNDMAFRWQLLTHKDEPLVVLRDSHDGDMRARAYRELQEPKLHGGSDQDQEAMLKILGTAAKSERSPVCRVAAIETLGKFKDPRAADALVEAFTSPINFGDKSPVVRIAIVRSLAEIGDPKGVGVLTQALAFGPEMDVRITAAEGLAKFQTSESTTALLRVLRNDKDVALRFEASQSLEKITGKKEMHPNAEEWDNYFRQVAASGEPKPKESRSLLRPASWFKESE